ncbi:MAG: hypothetical protein H8E41_07935 [Desulfobulbaceae bacterium]|uniref:Uncharacterized protein n=1 Tax=Candidatus Desulfobia pelagia TaxID=2841692 RepID=A0A8J6NFL7_9BACT|nr:hypothetical protein [Candidatus Desulfobia pelagia]
MQKHTRFVTVIILLSVLAGCVSAQQIREMRIRHNQELFNTFSADDQGKIQTGLIDIGFSEDMVHMAWGAPDRIYMRTTAAGTATVWSYTIYQPRIHSERMSIPVRFIDHHGRRRIEYHNVWVNRDTGEQYAVARVEFTEGAVSAIEQLIQ